MVRGKVDNFKSLSFFSFLRLHICRFSFFASFSPSIYGAAFERMFTSLCLCAIIRQCTITLLLFFVLLNCNCSLSAAHSVYLHFLGYHSQNLKVSFTLLRGSNSFPALNRIFLISYKRRVAIPIKDNQMTRSEVILLQDPTEKCPRVSFHCL